MSENKADEVVKKATEALLGPKTEHNMDHDTAIRLFERMVIHPEIALLINRAHE